MLQPWVNPRSEFYWFRRRVPKAYRMFGMPAEIKFSLGTKDWGEAVLRCQEENLRLARAGGGDRVGPPPHRSPPSSGHRARRRILRRDGGGASRRARPGDRVGAVAEEAERSQASADR